MSRFPFLAKIESAWRSSIEGDYDNHKVLSERTLQASLWAHLKDLAQSQYIFIEPRIQLPANAGERPRFVVPDIVVCRAKSIIAIIELKFAPRAKPDLTNDLKKLLALYSGRAQIELVLPRFLGVKVKDHAYRITEQTQFVLGCVSNKPPRGLSSTFESIQSTALKGRATVLFAVTEEDRACVVSCKRV